MRLFFNVNHACGRLDLAESHDLVRHALSRRPQAVGVHLNVAGGDVAPEPVIDERLKRVDRHLGRLRRPTRRFAAGRGPETLIPLAAGDLVEKEARLLDVARLGCWPGTPSARRRPRAARRGGRARRPTSAGRAPARLRLRRRQPDHALGEVDVLPGQGRGLAPPEAGEQQQAGSGRDRSATRAPSPPCRRRGVGGADVSGPGRRGAPAPRSRTGFGGIASAAR